MTRYSLPPGHGLCPMVPGAGGRNVYSMRTMDDAMLVKEALEAGTIRSAVVVEHLWWESNW